MKQNIKTQTSRQLNKRTSKSNFIHAGKPDLFMLLKHNKSCSRPIAANATVTATAPETSTEEDPAMNFATRTPTGMKKIPPTVGVDLFLECLTGLCILLIWRIFKAVKNGTHI